MEWYTGNAGEVRWRIFETDEEDSDVLNKSSEGFKTEGGAKNNLLVTYTLLGAYFVSTIRGQSFDAVEFYIDKDKHRWRVTAANNEIVAASHKGFTTEGGAKNNILMTYTMISAYLAKAALGN